jgi:Ulp1 protease family, C-terminal catalytic domain
MSRRSYNRRSYNRRSYNRHSKNRHKLKHKRRTRKMHMLHIEHKGGAKPKTMNCNPGVKGKTPNSETCLTTDALEKLKLAYNKENPANKIESAEPTQIWADLKDRMTTCKREDCWLNVIKDPKQREELDDQLFAPDMPKEWKHKPNTWLSNFDIMAVLEQYEKSHEHFKMIGPTPIDFDEKPSDKGGKCVWQDLCTFSLKHCLDEKKTKIGIIFNLDKHDQEGSHWISLFIDLDEWFMFFLDSAGETMPNEVKKLVKRIVKEGKGLGKKFKVYQNHPLEHQMGNTECGVYSLFFIITMLTGEADGKKLTTLQDKVSFFKKTRIPDKYIQKYRKVYFND